MHLFSLEQDNKNKKIIQNLVKNHFSLENESFEIFQEKLDNLSIPEKYKSILNNTKLISDGFGRFYTSCENIEDEGSDKSWNLLRYAFTSFVKCKMNYHSFVTNSVDYDEKSKGMKIFKALKKFYSEHGNGVYRLLNDIDNVRYSNGIDQSKVVEIIELLREFYYEEKHDKVNWKDIFKKVEPLYQDIMKKKYCKEEKIYLVISFNFADWFLASTGYSWDSCISMYSDYLYGAGLPGLIVDKNRAMIYFTKGNLTEYRGIKVHNKLNRSWLMLEEQGNIWVQSFYPNRRFINSTLNEIVGHSIFTNEFEKSYYPLDLLYFKNNLSAHIYSDSIIPHRYKSGKWYWNTGGSDIFCIEKNAQYLQYESVFDCEVTNIDNIIENNEELMNFELGSSPQYMCEHCNCHLTEDEARYTDYEVLCEDCYNELYTFCEHCDSEILVDDAIVAENGEVYCDSCRDKYLGYCDECGEYYDINEHSFYEMKNSEMWCEKCIIRNNILICNDCGIVLEEDEKIEIEETNEIFCRECLQSHIDKKQRFLEFVA